MRITANTLTDRLLTQLNRLSTEQSRLTQEMASGKKLQEASDDVPATSRVMAYESEKRALRQYEQNGSIARTQLAVSGTGIASLRTIGSTAFNIGPAASMSGDPGTRLGLATQLNAFVEQAYSLANTQVNGVYLYGAQANNTAPFTATRAVTGEITAVTYTSAAGAAGNSIAVDVSESLQVNTGTSGTENTQLQDFINHLVALRDAVIADNKPGIAAAQNALGDDDDFMVAMQSALTAGQTRIELAGKQNRTRFDSLADLSSKDTDADMAETIVKFQNSQRAYEAALKAGSQVSNQSLLDFI